MLEVYVIDKKEEPSLTFIDHELILYAARKHIVLLKLNPYGELNGRELFYLITVRAMLEEYAYWLEKVTM